MKKVGDVVCLFEHEYGLIIDIDVNQRLYKVLWFDPTFWNAPEIEYLGFLANLKTPADLKQK